MANQLNTTQAKDAQKDPKSTNSQGVKLEQTKMNVTHEDLTSNKEFPMTFEKMQELMSQREELRLLNEVRIALRVKKKHDMEELEIKDKNGNLILDDKGQPKIAELYKLDVTNEDTGEVTVFVKKEIYNQVDEKKLYIFHGELTTKGEGTRFFKLDKFHKVESIDRVLMSQIPF